MNRKKRVIILDIIYKGAERDEERYSREIDYSTNDDDSSGIHSHASDEDCI